MFLKLNQAGQPSLRQSTKIVSSKLLATERIQTLIDDMIATLADAPGVGLAAPQVGESLRIIVIEDKAEYHEAVFSELLAEQQRIVVPCTVLVNPSLEVLDNSLELYFEGCLSIDGYVAVVPRAKHVKVTGLDRHGKAQSIIAAGWYARILQHEIDHLAGSLYIDTMYAKSFMSIKNFAKLWRKSLSADISQAFHSPTDNSQKQSTPVN